MPFFEYPDFSIVRSAIFMLLLSSIAISIAWSRLMMSESCACCALPIMPDISREIQKTVVKTRFVVNILFIIFILVPIIILVRKFTSFIQIDFNFIREFGKFIGINSCFVRMRLFETIKNFIKSGIY